MKPEISVIVPVYNVEPFLRRCLSSVVNQSMKEIEILVIDDGSTDKSGIICDEYAKLDNRIKVTHQENGGLSHARNVGLDQAQGKYIMFVDSDDYVDKDFCYIPYNLAIENKAELIMFESTHIYKTYERDYIDNSLENGIKTTQESIDIMLKQLGVAVWNKLFKKEIVDNIRFPLNCIFEDCAFTYRCVLKSKKTIFIKQPLYYYVIRKDSLSHEKNLKRFDYISTYYEMYSNLQKTQYKCYIRPDVLRCSLRYLYSFGVNGKLSKMAHNLVCAFVDYSKLLKTELILLYIYRNSKCIFGMLHFFISIFYNYA